MSDQKKLKEILKMSLKLSDQEMKDFKPGNVDEERKKWLQQAIDNILENDDGKKLLAYTNMFLSFNPDDNFTDHQLTDLVSIFEEISFLCEGFDISKEFDRMGGLIHCLKFLKSQYTSLHWRAADLIANSIHNNPKSQQNVMANNGVEKLLYALKTSDVEIVKVKCLYALSTLVGSFEPAQQLFIQLKGIDFILKLLKDSTGKLRIKTVFLLQKFIWTDKKFDELNYSHIFEDLLFVLKEDLEDDTHQIILNSIVHLVEIHTELKDLFKSKCSVKNLGFLEERVESLTLKDKEKYEDEIVMYNKLLQL